MSTSIRLAGNTISNSEIDSLCDWLKSYPRLTKSGLTQDFQGKFSSYINSSFSCFVNSGSSANLLIAAANLYFGNLRNKKILVPAVSWSTTLAPFIQLGYEPILVDCDPTNLGINIDDLKDKIIRHDPATIILVHVLGHDSSIELIANLCKEHDIRLFEDTCEALGSRIESRLLGTFGLASSFSFYFGHHISTIEGGMVCTSNFEFYQLLCSIRSHGWSRDLDHDFARELQSDNMISDFRNLYTFYFPGFNLRATEISAFLGLSQLDKLDFICAKRSELFNVYLNELPDYWSQSSRTSLVSSFAYGTLVLNPQDVHSHLLDNGIESRPLICGSLGLQPFWRSYHSEFTNLKFADIVHNSGIYLPLHPDLDSDDIKHICSIFKQVALPLSF